MQGIALGVLRPGGHSNTEPSTGRHPSPRTFKELDMANRVNHQDIVKRLVDTKAIDFKAIGATFAEVGPALSLADEPWEGFCGTMRTFIRVFIIHGPVLGNVEGLADLRAVAGELKG
jgi:hypothetical protein